MSKYSAILRTANLFYKLAAEDTYVYTYVPRKAIDYIRQKGLLSAAEIIKDKKALSLARPGETKEYTERVKERLEDPEWKDYMVGISTFFTLPDFQQINEKHNIFKFDLVPIRINLSQLLKDQPKTKTHGVELEPFNSKLEDQPSREKEISLKDIREYTLQTPKQIWKHYDNQGSKLYAPNVPHLIIVTPTNKIQPKYLLA